LKSIVWNTFVGSDFQNFVTAARISTTTCRKIMIETVLEIL